MAQEEYWVCRRLKPAANAGQIWIVKIIGAHLVGACGPITDTIPTDEAALVAYLLALDYLGPCWWWSKQQPEQEAERDFVLVDPPGIVNLGAREGVG